MPREPNCEEVFRPVNDLLDEVRRAARLQHLSLHTEDTAVSSVRRFVRFHNRQHPRILLIMILFLLLQKEFVTRLTAGAVKG